MLTKYLVLVVAFGLKPGCLGDDCTDYADEFNPEYPDCTLDFLLDEFRGENEISKECCEGDRHLHDRKEAGLSKCDKGNATMTHANSRYVCADSRNHTSPPSLPLHVQNCTEPCSLQLRDDIRNSTRNEGLETEDGTPIKEYCEAYICDLGDETWTVGVTRWKTHLMYLRTGLCQLYIKLTKTGCPGHPQYRLLWLECFYLGICFMFAVGEEEGGKEEIKLLDLLALPEEKMCCAFAI